MACLAPAMGPAMFIGAPMQGMPGGTVFSPTPMGFMPMMAPAHPMMGMVRMTEAQDAQSSIDSKSKPACRPKLSNAKQQRSTPKGRQEPRSSKATARRQGAAHAGSCSLQLEPEEDATGTEKGVILSLLQEFIQCSKQFPPPQHRPILQWSFDTHMADCTNLEFRAQVAFLLDGVAHHVAGCWQPSKKMAQRDTAERCLGFFVGTWGAFLLNQNEGPDAESSQGCSVDPSGSAEELVELLDKFSQSLSAGEEECPSWSVEWTDTTCHAEVELTMLGVRHTFRGVAFSSAEEAKADTAKRVLWYLQCPGFEQLYEADPLSLAAVAKEMPAPAASWVATLQNGKSSQAAERKTMLMRVQNRLQQVFARQLKPGQGVWEWSYETDPDDTAWPPTCRATVQIPAAKQVFEGPWVRGQREAQIETCHLVMAFLNSPCSSLVPGSSPTSADSMSTPSEASGASQDKVEALGALLPGKVTSPACQNSKQQLLAKGGC
eukprot:TRINITY_DN1575_c0_g1_i3.p1 TRINITY_DN1575_c0_g1~~TRINITY_DN1575_c0_g1_i3.p1  ORF type:complete len:490 (+),score=102.66 TRINITY_DN1575_c0_g1_i3:80-1549(+)